MISKPITSYIVFGTQLRYLIDVSHYGSVTFDSKDGVSDNITRFLSGLEEFNLKVTFRAAQKLKNFKEKIESKGKGYTLSYEEQVELVQIVTTLRETLYAEASGLVEYVVTEKRIDVNKLLNNVSGLMAPGVFDLLSEQAKLDFVEAGKCIAFERATAAAFHLLRGTESELRVFYKKEVLRGRIASDLWGNLTDDLRKKKNAPPKSLLDNLDNIRFNFRNPTQHPEKNYDIHEVQDLFSLCVDVISRMIKLQK